MTTSDPALAERFCLAWRDADYDALGEMLAEDAQWIMTGRSRFAGMRNGRDAIIAMRRQMSELTGGTWRALRDDSYDIVSSEYHAFAIDRFLAEHLRRDAAGMSGEANSPAASAPILSGRVVLAIDLIYFAL